MLGALAVIAEAILRVEHKIDVLIRALGLAAGVHPQMSFTGQLCPVCKEQAEYLVDVMNQVVKRKCGCTSGKQPPLVPLIPAPTAAPAGAPNGNPADPDGAEDRAPRAKDRSRRQGR